MKLGAYASLSCRDTLWPDSDTSGCYRPRHLRDSWHYDTLSSPQLQPDRANQRRTTGRTELLEDGHRHRYRQGSSTLLETTGQIEQRAEYAGVNPRQADCTTKRPLWSRPTRQSNARDSEPSFAAAAEAQAGYGFADIAEERSYQASRYGSG